MISRSSGIDQTVLHAGLEMTDIVEAVAWHVDSRVTLRRFASNIRCGRGQHVWLCACMVAKKGVLRNAISARRGWTADESHDVPSPACVFGRPSASEA